MSAERYKPSVKVDHAKQFIVITDLLNLGRPLEAWEVFKDHIKDMADFGGALASQLPQTVVVDLTDQCGELGLYQTKSVVGQPDTLYTIRLAESGARASIEIAGSPGVTYGLSATKGGMDPGRTGYGAGTGTPLPGVAGEYLSWSYQAPQGGQNMRPQLLG